MNKKKIMDKRSKKPAKNKWVKMYSRKTPGQENGAYSTFDEPLPMKETKTR